TYVMHAVGRSSWLEKHPLPILLTPTRPSVPHRRDLLLAGATGLLIGSVLLLVPKRYFRMPQQEQSFVARVAHYQLDIADVVTRGIRELGVGSEELKGKRILLKPNLVETAKGAPHINTHPL